MVNDASARVEFSWGAGFQYLHRLNYSFAFFICSAEREKTVADTWCALLICIRLLTFNEYVAIISAIIPAVERRSIGFTLISNKTRRRIN